MEQEKKSSLSWLFWLLLIIVVASITGTVVYNNEQSIREFMNPVEENSYQDTLVEDTVYGENASIQDILEFREHIKECNRIDSVYLHMPEVVLIDILTNYGTDISTADIVYIYESNPNTYNAVQSGARAEQYRQHIKIDSIRNYPPDTIPKKLNADNGN